MPVSYTHLDVYKRQGVKGRNHTVGGRGELAIPQGETIYRQTNTANLKGLDYGQIRLVKYVLPGGSRNV